jgi:hypothetical protein
MTQFGDFFNDMVVHITLSAVSAANSAYWQAPAQHPASGAELVSYIEFVGQKLLKKVKFTVNGNPLDDYNYDVQNYHQKFYVTPNKTYGWYRNVGQELPKTGYSQVDFNSATGLYGRGAGVRQGIQFFDGPQTPQPTQPALDLWIPLLFWFNMDPRLAIPSVSIPYGQRFIDIDLANASEILQHQHAYDPNFDSPATNPVTTPDVTVCELYINNIFVNPEIHDIFIKRIGFSLIRVHRFQSTRVNKTDDNILLQQMKWPIETLYIGLRPAQNIDTTSPLMLNSWHLYGYCQTVNVSLAALQNGWSWNVALLALPAGITAAQYTANFVSYNGLALDFVAALSSLGYIGIVAGTILSVEFLNAALLFNGFATIPLGTIAAPNFPGSAAAQPSGAQLGAALPAAEQQATYLQETRTITSLNLEAHGVPLYRDIPSAFFNQYIPYIFGGFHWNTPVDVGLNVITFNLYPGAYQPSGHVNVSRAREFYLHYYSSLVGTNTVPSADLVVVGIAIEMLDGKSTHKSVC